MLTVTSVTDNNIAVTDHNIAVTHSNIVAITGVFQRDNHADQPSPHPYPISKSGQIESLVVKGAQCSETYAKIIYSNKIFILGFDEKCSFTPISFKLGTAYVSENSNKTK